MTDENTAESDALQRVVPKGCDAVDDLTVQELNIAATKIGADVVQALSGMGKEGVHRVNALAHLAWLWERRSNPRARIDEFLTMKGGDLGTILGFNDDEDDDETPDLPTQDSTSSD